MKRRLLKLAVFLLLGAILNVAVAWGLFSLSATTALSDNDHVSMGDALAMWTHAMPNKCAPEIANYGGGATTGCRWIGVSGSCECFSRSEGGHIIEFQAGYPLWSLWGQRWTSESLELRVVGLIQLTESRGLSDRAESTVPCIPIWPGFAINTMFYAAILALLFYGPGKVRRFVRVRRWRCPACAYLIAPGTCASGVCSECGATLPRSFQSRLRPLM